MQPMQCTADAHLSSALLLGIPGIVLVLGWLVWTCYGAQQWKPIILARRDALRSKLINLFK
ncbi:hypothetical protein ACVBEF_06300 [Glaciimonas sp. GG7]